MALCCNLRTAESFLPCLALVFATQCTYIRAYREKKLESVRVYPDSGFVVSGLPGLKGCLFCLAPGSFWGYPESILPTPGEPGFKKKCLYNPGLAQRGGREKES